MLLSAKTIRLDLIHPFRISRSVSAYKENVLVSLSDGAFTGMGEAAPSAYYGQDAVSAHAALVRPDVILPTDPFDLEIGDKRLRTALPGQSAACAAIDMALHDLAGRRLGIPLYRWFGLDPTRAPLTSFTIGIDDPETIEKKLREAASFPILKVKLGTERDLEILKTVRTATNATLRVDANAGWSRERAKEMVRLLPDFDVELVEQPLPPDDRDGLRMLRDISPVPIFLDESIQVSSDIPRFAGCMDGVNIKLMKCGGLREALRLIHTARAHGLRVMIGCMIESSVAITAAAHLSPLTDHADLDGHLLIANDPFEGVKVREGRLILPDRPGLGVVRKKE